MASVRNLLGISPPGIHDRRVLALRSGSKGDVERAVNALAGEREGSRAEGDLLALLHNGEEEESQAPLWAAVALGRMGSRRAVPLLLAVLDSGADILCEAAAEALVHILLRHGESLLDSIEAFIEERMDHDPSSARLHAYEPIAALRSCDRAKRFLIRAFEMDDTWQGSVAHDLARFGDRRVLMLFRRAIEFATQSHDFDLLKELREAYCVLGGVRFSYLGVPELWERPWAERWARELECLGKTDAEIEALDASRFPEADDAARLARYAEEDAIRDSHTLLAFDIDAYLAVRERDALEEEFDRALRILGWDDRWDVEAVERMISRARHRDEVLATIATRPFPSESSMREFADLLDELWHHTPREELSGLTPHEMEDIPRLREGNDRIAAKRRELREEYFAGG